MNDKIDILIARRNKLTDRRDGLTDSKRIKAIDAQLAQVPPGERNDVDRLLGRACATPTPRADYALLDKCAAVVEVLQRDMDRAAERSWIQAQSVTVAQAAPIAEAMRDEFLEWIADQTEDMKDFLGSRGDLAL